MRTKYILIPCFFALSILFSAYSPQEKAMEYISMHEHWAVENMHKFGIPASICLAQAIMESSYGSSELCISANNHFGIKCHDWAGESYSLDDDDKDENGDLIQSCFRKYNSAKESFDDYGAFLSQKDRYSALFELNQTDYKGWAQGLEAAGYATNELYAERLIDIIDRYKLHKYDVEKSIVQAGFDPHSSIIAAYVQPQNSTLGGYWDASTLEPGYSNANYRVSNTGSKANTASVSNFGASYASNAPAPPPCPQALHNPKPSKTKPFFKSFRLK